MEGKVVIVTGGSGLIGRAIIADLNNKGAIAINADINAASDLTKGTYHCDVTLIGSIEKLVDAVISKYNKIDGLVNNAYPRTTDWGNHFEDIHPSSWQKNVDLQLNSVFYTNQVVIKQMLKQQEGAIVNMASIYGILGPDFSVYAGTSMTMPAAYSAIKGGIINFTRYLASAYGHANIRVNSISPGGIFDNQPESFVKLYSEKTPLNRMGRPDDISGPVTFLLSDDSRYITGHNLIVDGGWTIK